MRPSSLFVSARDGTRLFVRYTPHDLLEERGSPASEGVPPPEIEGGLQSAPRPTAILNDGIACDGFIWKYLFEDVARHANVVHWHYRGHGRSARPNDTSLTALTDHARDMDTVRRMVAKEPVVLFGHSMGCQVALEGYRLHPENVAGLVLICGSYGRVTHTFKGTDVMAQLLPGAIRAVDKHTRIARGLWGNFSPELALRIALMTGEVDARSIAAEDLLPYMKHMVDIDLPMFLRMLHSAGEHSARDLLPNIHVPVLVIAGDRDTFTPTRYAEEMARLIPKAKLVVLPGTHVIPIERKDQVSALVAEFFESLRPAEKSAAGSEPAAADGEKNVGAPPGEMRAGEVTG
ncbi:MAG: alpha/beta hydrolase [Polyangiaceae bacterium]|nr:alpha/beta hydrolase [Polyangiaceae bacterium]